MRGICASQIIGNFITLVAIIVDGLHDLQSRGGGGGGGGGGPARPPGGGGVWVVGKQLGNKER